MISAVGFLSAPRIPRLAREEADFSGVICHTAQWPDRLDLSGKRVGVLGTGSSAVQVIPEAAKCAAQVKVFQREPNWLLPKGARDYSPRERRINRHPIVRRWRRFSLYQTLLEPHVTLVPHGVKGLTATGVVDDNGDRHDLDVVVLATGFNAADYLAGLKVTGPGGRDLHAMWAEGPWAFLGMMVPGFPNFFMMYGPNTNSVPLVSFYEAQARFAAHAIRRLADRGARDVRVSPTVARLYDRWLQRALTRTVWAETDSYFRSRTGRIVSQWPFNATQYLIAARIGRLALRYHGPRP